MPAPLVRNLILPEIVFCAYGILKYVCFTMRYKNIYSPLKAVKNLFFKKF